jgi:hypothetical protein
MPRGTTFVAAALFASAVSARPAPGPPVAVYKDASCGCCTKWVKHLRDNGFTVTSTDVPDIQAVKKKHNVPETVSSCHTALVNGYVIEGHVPAADVRALLQKRPAVLGLAAPGMPVGSPGMEGSDPEAYDVLTFDRQGATKVFATHRP